MESKGKALAVRAQERRVLVMVLGSLPVVGKDRGPEMAPEPMEQAHSNVASSSVLQLVVEGETNAVTLM